MEGPLIAFVLAAGSGLLLSVLTWWLARKSGLQPAQTTLINTLKDNADALTDQVKILRDELNSEVDRRKALEKKVTELQTTVYDLAIENADLRKRLRMPSRTVEGTPP